MDIEYNLYEKFSNFFGKCILLIINYKNYLKHYSQMFCCGPKNIFLSVSKPQINFDDYQLYTRPLSEIISEPLETHPLAKQSFITFDNNQNITIKTHSDQKQQLIFHLSSANRELSMTKVNLNKHEQQIWRVLGSNQSHALAIGDKIIIGQTELLVYDTNNNKKKSCLSKQEISVQRCRYCHMNTYEKDDPLLNLCRCSGSVKYMHLGCLRNWMMMKVQAEQNEKFTYYVFRQFKCELCKQNWPKTFPLNGQNMSLLNFDVPLSTSGYKKSSPYLVLETDTLSDQDLQVKVFVKFHFANHAVTIGNMDNEFSDFSLESLGVSDLHCTLSFVDNNFYITDSGSKVGTLVSLGQQEQFTSKSGMIISFKGLFLQIKIEEGSFFACLTSETYKLNFKKKGY